VAGIAPGARHNAPTPFYWRAAKRREESGWVGGEREGEIEKRRERESAGGGEVEALPTRAGMAWLGWW